MKRVLLTATIIALLAGGAYTANAGFFDWLFPQRAQEEVQDLGANVLYPLDGGTGTSTAPSTGDVLVGQSDGTYAPQATSTLGISGGGDVATDAIWDAKGDLAAGTGADTAIRLAVGADGQILTASSTASSGLAWSTPASGGNVSNSGTPADNQLAIWTDATTIEGSSAITYDGTTFTVTGTSSLATTTISSLEVTAAFNADTATSLATNGANCSAGNAPLGVDASGAVESCTDFEEDLSNEAGLYAALSDVTNFLQTGDALAGDDITDGSVDGSELEDTAVTAGTYGSSTAVLTITVDDDGRLTNVSTTSVTFHDAVTLAGEDYLTLSGQQITAVAIDPDNLSASDFGDFSCNGTTCTLDTSTVDTGEIADNSIIEPDLNADNAANDGDILTYDSTGTNFAWITPNAGTDVTADLEEETHASEHSDGAADEIVADNLATACSDGQILEASGGGWVCAVDNAGGSGIWATSTGIAYPSPTSTIIVVGSNATSTTGTIFEVTGNSLFTGNLSIATGNALIVGANTLTTGDLLDGEQIANDTIDIDSIDWAALTDLTEGGAVVWGNIAEGELANDTVLEADLKAVNAAVDEDILTYENTTGDFEWHTPAELSLQAQGDVLDDLNNLGAPTADGQFIVATGAGAFAYESTSTARASLNVDVAGTDNSTNVTLAGTPNYLTLSGQEITLNKLDITDDTNATGGVGVDITANDFTIDLNELTTETSIAAGDFVPFYDISPTGQDKITFANFEAALALGNLSGNSDNITEGATNLFNQTHTGEVTGATALTIASGVVDSDNITNATILGADLSTTTTLLDGELLAYVSATDNFTSLTCAEITGDASLCDSSDADTQNTLDQAYDEGGAGAGRTIDVDSGAVELTVSNTDNNVGLIVNQNDSTNNPYAIRAVSPDGYQGTLLQLEGADDAFNGPELEFYLNTAAPQNFDPVGTILFYGEDSASNKQLYGTIGVEAADISTSTEDSYIYFQTNLAGANATRLLVGNGENGISVGANSAAGVVESNGNQNLVLQTGNGTTGDITITDGANGLIDISPNGTGNVQLGTLVFDADQSIGVGQDNYILTYDNGSGLISLEAASGGGANTALSNLASVAINESLVSDTDNTDALGSAAIGWSDLYLGNGSVITWSTAPSTADATLTHSANTLTLDGATLALGANNLTIHSGTWDSGGVDLATGDTYAINGTDVLTSTTLGSAVVNSSLTSVGTITSGVWNGTAINTTYILDDTLINADLNIDVEAVDGDFLQYDSTGDNFTWRSGSETLGDIGAEGDLANEAGLYAALSDVSQFWEAGDTINSGTLALGSLSFTGTLPHENGGLELDISSVGIGDIIAGVSAGTLEIVDGGAASDGDVLTIQADGTVEWEAAGAGGLFTESGTFTYLTSTTQDLVVGANATTTAPFFWDTSATSTIIGTGGSLYVGANNLIVSDLLDGEQIANDTIDVDSIDWAAMTDLTEGGAVVWSNIAEGELPDGSVVEADLKVVNAPNDEEIFTYESTTGDFEWHTLGELGIQAQDAVLDDLSALTVVADNEFIVGTGAGTYGHESGATALTSLENGAINILTETEIDASSELLALIDDETGTGVLVFGTSPTIATPVLTGKIDRNNVAVDDDDCTGEQGLYWYDTTDSAFEFCNANSGTPTTLGGGASVSFGADNQIPYTNGTTDDFDYSSNFTFDGTDFIASSSVLVAELDEGQVGIGTSTPSAALDVIGDFELTGNIVFAGDTIDELVGDGLTLNANDLIFDCSAVASTGLGCSGEDMILGFTDEAGLYSFLSDVTQFWEAGDTINSGTLALDSLSFTGTLNHEYGGLEVDVSAYSGLLAISGGATSEVDAKSELEAQIADVSDFAEADGDTFTGVHDFGGATSIEIVNGTNPTVDASGEIAVNTTAASSSIRFHDGAAERALFTTTDKSLALSSSTLAYLGGYSGSGTTTMLIGNYLRPITLTNIYCKTDQGTALVRFGDGTNLTETITCSTSGASDDGSIANSTWTAREDFEISVGTQTSNPGIITITATIRQDAD